MTNIKNFIDRVSALDSRPGKDLIMSAYEAKMLRDDIAKLMADRLERPVSVTDIRPSVEPIILSGGTFK